MARGRATYVETLRSAAAFGLVCLAIASLPHHAHAQHAADGGDSLLKAELADVQAELDETSRLWPSLMLATGAASVAFGVVAGIGYIEGCDGGGCSVPPWVALSVVIGAAVGTGGAILLTRANHDIAQLRMKASMLQMELDRYPAQSALRRRELALQASTPRWLSLRVAF